MRGLSVRKSVRMLVAGAAAVGLSGWLLAGAGVLAAGVGVLTPASASAAGGPFTCLSPEDFLLVGVDLYQAAEPATPGTASYSAFAGYGGWNALGFDPANGYLYAIASTASPDLLQIDSAGTITDLGVPTGLPAGEYATGGFDPAGDFWVTADGTDEAYEINVTTSPPTATAVALTGDSWAPRDWTYADGYFWGLEDDAVYRLDPGTGTITAISAPTVTGDAGLTDNDFEGAWTRADGDLAFFTLAGDQVVVYSITDAATPELSYVAYYASGSGASSTSADGASCAQAEITTSSLPSGLAGESYSATLAAEGGPVPADYSWALGGGSLPPGLSLDPGSGTISGSPTTPGTYTFSVQVTANGAFPVTAEQSYTMTVTQPLTIGTSSLPDAGYGQPYSTTLSASGGTGPYTWAVQGSLPPGLTLDAGSGTISGTATAAGSYSFTVQASDSSTPQQTATEPLTLTVDPAPLTITAASGTMTYGGSPPVITAGYTGFVNGDGPGSLTTPPACSAGATSSSPAGTYQSSCSGAADANYAISYVAGTVTVTQAGTTLTYTGPESISAGTALVPSATLTSPASACQASQAVSFSLNTNPVTGAAGPYSLESAVTGASGAATGAPVSTSGWQAGAYTLTASYAGTVNCAMSTATSPLAVTTPGLAAAGAGTYPVTGAGTVKFGFVVAQVPHTAKYAGVISLVSGGWWLNGTLSSYVNTSSTQGTAAGTGSLSWWNQALNHGRGGWQLAKTGVAFTVTFAATTKTSPGAFGVQIGYTPVAPQPAPLPNSSLTTLTAGTILIA